MRQNIGRLTDAQLFINHGIQRIREEVITTENGIDTIHIDRIDRAFPLNFVIFELLNSTYSFKGDVSDAWSGRWNRTPARASGSTPNPTWRTSTGDGLW